MSRLTALFAKSKLHSQLIELHLLESDVDEYTESNIRKIVKLLHKEAMSHGGAFERNAIYDACAAIGINEKEWGTYELRLTRYGWAQQWGASKFALTNKSVMVVEAED
ncbi:uncharacterized protein SOCE26_048930 [Sorangium cellulosum]|uniref:Uncharacterized protein n=2 Tax=Sorangium cellulosum TaxID=56 RepID=A0A2L0EW11_SORCE|nr:uncharacterized protein SOCE26_048930 [Sorangium cellulosum]